MQELARALAHTCWKPNGRSGRGLRRRRPRISRRASWHWLRRIWGAHPHQ